MIEIISIITRSIFGLLPFVWLVLLSINNKTGKFKMALAYLIVWFLINGMIFNLFYSIGLIEVIR